MLSNHLINRAARTALLVVSLCAAMGTSAVIIPNTPLSTQAPVKPMVMLVAGKDHRLFYEAYNDASDIDGDGTLDIRFKPKITYLGLFQSEVCYTHNNDSTNAGAFTPSGKAGAANSCSGKWSGNWLNYVTTSRIDALRVVLYGGYREVDTEASTILRRAYIPQDAHSWAKEYSSEAIDGYKISDYTPLSEPVSGARHFFGSLTPNAGVDCATLETCSNMPPWLSVVLNSTKRVWEWASTERPVLADATHGGTRTNYTVRVHVCLQTYLEGCRRYTNGNHKPAGLLHDYGESDAMLFGLLTGSYDRNMSGGRLRKVVSSFKNEVNPDTGIFTADAAIVQTFNALRVRDFNNGNTGSYYKWGWWSAARTMKSGEYPDWGNPVAEMMYEATRYFAGKASATVAYAGVFTIDEEVRMPKAKWDDPYASTSAANAPYCARGNMLVISDVNVSFDSDELPGIYPGFVPTDPGFSDFKSDLTELNVSKEATFITQNESTAKGLRFIGHAGAASDFAPSPKDVTDLGQIRGLAPEEPTKQGSYYASSVSYFAKNNDLRANIQGKQSLDTFVVALASPLPRISVNMPNDKVITLVPFAKTISGIGISKAKGDIQPTNQIVDLYIDGIANSGAADANPAVNGGRYSATFRINYEDVEQGADHDMDVIVEYKVFVDDSGKLQVTVKPVYQGGGLTHRMGYIISGTTKDGVYLVTQDEAEEDAYYLNTPPTRDPGYCDVTSPPADCKRLPYLGGGPGYDADTRQFEPSKAGATAEFLKDPLWYAAKWGGFKDSNGNGKPDLDSEWEKSKGVPQNYLLVQNPVGLKESLKKALDDISMGSSSASNITANSTSLNSGSHLYQAAFKTQRWSGDVIASPVTTNGVGNTPAWNAAEALPEWGDRNIFVRLSGGETERNPKYKQMSSEDKHHFVNMATYQYLRGERDEELQKPDGTMRDRDHPLGDIVHSSPYYDIDNKVVYVGANDGMLHAFNGENGKELFAFIPRAVVPRLKNLAAAGYTHEYFVDGSIEVTRKSSGTGNNNYLFAMLGRGGKGLFALNVTTPSSFGAGDFLWEYTSDGSVAAGKTDSDLGYMIGRPTFVKLNNGKSGLIAGNGYNSTSGMAALYIFIINADGSLNSVKKISAGPAGDNGLASPAFVDSDNNGTADFVYAGDLLGNVWKFDLRATDPADWKLALSDAPLFVAKGGAKTLQPITAPMFTAINNRPSDPNFGKRFVFFGTGSYFKAGDATNEKRQTWYGLIDEDMAISGKSDLIERTMTNETFDGIRVRIFSKATPNDMQGKKGWYLDLDSTVAGERIVTASQMIYGSAAALIVNSMYPVPSDPCVPGGGGFANVIDPFSGSRSESPVLDINGNNQPDEFNSKGESIDSHELNQGVPGDPIQLDPKVCIGGSDATIVCKTVFGSVKKQGRISWREIVRD
jgi:type IV pilus assembly protein PilY1